MKHRHITPTLVVTLGLFVVAWSVVVGAFNPQPEPPARFGMVGLARGQTARLNVVNLIHPPDPQFPPDPQHVCRVTLGFVDAAGQTFSDRTGAEIVSEVSLPPGHAAFLDLRSGDVFHDDRTRRVQLRAGLEGIESPDDGTPDPCASLAATLEIFDNETARTMVLYTPPDPVVPASGDTMVR